MSTPDPRPASNPPPLRGMGAVLLRLTGDPEPPRRLSRAETFIGRDPTCDVFTPSASCSRRHAVLRVVSGGPELEVMLVDLESRNGSYVNGERVIGSRRLREHDVLEFGGTRFAFLLRTPSELAAESRLLELATRDALTGLANRPTFSREADRELARAVRYGRNMTIVLLDLDRLKRLNDDHGHATGDLALRAVATTLKAEIRGYDLAARLGGDEFALLLPESTAEGAIGVVARIRARLARTPIEADAGPITVTISAGIADLSGGAATAAELVSQADRALYADKPRDGARSTTLTGAAPEPQMSNADSNADSNAGSNAGPS